MRMLMQCVVKPSVSPSSFCAMSYSLCLTLNHGCSCGEVAMRERYGKRLPQCGVCDAVRCNCLCKTVLGMRGADPWTEDRKLGDQVAVAQAVCCRAPENEWQHFHLLHGISFISIYYNIGCMLETYGEPRPYKVGITSSPIWRWIYCGWVMPPHCKGPWHTMAILSFGCGPTSRNWNPARFSN